MAHPLLRASAVVCSATLLIGFVVFRSGGCNATRDTSSRAAAQPSSAPFVVMPGSKSNAHDADGQNVLYGDGKAQFFPGSKSGLIVPTHSSPEEFRAMAGSKSMVVTGSGSLSGLVPPSATQPATAPATTPSEPTR